MALLLVPHKTLRSPFTKLFSYNTLSYLFSKTTLLVSHCISPLTEQPPSQEGSEVGLKHRAQEAKCSTPQMLAALPFLFHSLSLPTTCRKQKCRWLLLCLRGSKGWLWKKDMLLESQAEPEPSPHKNPFLLPFHSAGMEPLLASCGWAPTPDRLPGLPLPLHRAAAPGS